MNCLQFERFKKKITVFIFIIYSACILSSSLINLTHYLHHLVEHTLYEHEHGQYSESSLAGLHDHTHGEILDKFLQKIVTSEESGHEHALLAVMLMEHINSATIDLEENFAHEGDYLLRIKTLNSNYTPQPLSPPPK